MMSSVGKLWDNALRINFFKKNFFFFSFEIWHLAFYEFLINNLYEVKIENLKKNNYVKDDLILFTLSRTVAID